MAGSWVWTKSKAAIAHGLDDGGGRAFGAVDDEEAIGLGEPDADAAPLGRGEHGGGDEIDPVSGGGVEVADFSGQGEYGVEAE